MHCLTKLVEHCAWANETWIGFIAEHAAADDYAVTRMSHILLGERAWFRRIAGDEPDPDIWQALSLAVLGDMQARHRSLYGDLLAGDCHRIVPYTRLTGERYQSSISDILLHLVTHGAHHRGQLAAHIAAKGLHPVNADFVQFCIQNRV